MFSAIDWRRDSACWLANVWCCTGRSGLYVCRIDLTSFSRMLNGAEFSD